MEKTFTNFPDGIYQIPWLNRAVWLIVQPWGELVVAKIGAQILHYQPRGHRPVFWLNIEPQTLVLPQELVLSAKLENQQQLIDSVQSYCYLQGAVTTDLPLRGGVPLCWPWFGAHSVDSSLPAHGLARNAQWQLDSSKLFSEGSATTMLCFKPVQSLTADLDVSFNIKVTSDNLQLEISSQNISSEPLVMTQAIHSYFAVADLQKIIVKGLKGCEYLNKLDNYQLKHQQEELTNINNIDNIYKHSAEAIIIDDEYNREIVLTKKNSHSTVVWNPADKARLIGINKGHQQFICVEAANTIVDEVCLEPLHSFSMQQNITLKHKVTSDYHY
jgi:glucose-6-phosphate 1-epimerase